MKCLYGEKFFFRKTRLFAWNKLAKQCCQLHKWMVELKIYQIFSVHNIENNSESDQTFRNDNYQGKVDKEEFLYNRGNWYLMPCGNFYRNKCIVNIAVEKKITCDSNPLSTLCIKERIIRLFLKKSVKM